jgi:hypothetical protein
MGNSYKLKAESSMLPSETPVCDREPCGLFHGAGKAESVLSVMGNGLWVILKAQSSKAIRFGVIGNRL